jgi:hypothetical protein
MYFLLPVEIWALIGTYCDSKSLFYLHKVCRNSQFGCRVLLKGLIENGNIKKCRMHNRWCTEVKHAECNNKDCKGARYLPIVKVFFYHRLGIYVPIPLNYTPILDEYISEKLSFKYCSMNHISSNHVPCGKPNFLLDKADGTGDILEIVYGIGWHSILYIHDPQILMMERLKRKGKQVTLKDLQKLEKKQKKKQDKKHGSKEEWKYVRRKN